MIGTHPTLLALILTLSGSVAIAQPPAEPLSLWYRQPAKQWVEALAVGNGRLGAMVFGGVAQERIQLNEDTLWAGGPYDPANPDALEALPKVRELIFAGRYREAQQSDRSEDDGQAPDPNALSVRGGPVAEVPGCQRGDGLSARPQPGYGRGHRRVYDRWSALHARSLLQPRGSGHRDSPDGGQARQGHVHGRHEDAAEGVGDGRVAQYSGDAGRQRGLSRHCRRVEVSGPRGRCGFGRSDRAGRRPDHRRRCGFRTTADRGGDQLQELQRRDRRPRSADQRDNRQGEREVFRRVAQGPCGRASEAVSSRHAGPRHDRCRPTSDRRADSRPQQGERSATGGPLLPVRPLSADRQLAAGRPAGESAGHLERQHESALGAASTRSTSIPR